MKVAYIAHPIGGDIKENLKRIEAIARRVNLEEPEVVPFANYFLDCHALDDNIPEERERGIKNDIALMRKGFIDELRLYGDRISAGMRHEVDMAIELGIEVKPMTEATMKEYEECWRNALSIKRINEPIHDWFELSYAQYLTIPRSVLQSMPEWWQVSFVKCLERLDESIDWRPRDGRYYVYLRDAQGRFIHDPLMDYNKGRSRVSVRGANFKLITGNDAQE